jgi:uncharacterized membrane protein YgcG
MQYRSHLRFFSLAVILTLSVPIALRAQDDNTNHGRKYKAPPPAAHIEVTVLKDFNGKPVDQAHVIFHPVEGDKDKGALEVKTNEDGKAVIDVIPIGDTVTLQVIANGYQTYGQNYKIDKSDMSMEVRLKRPVGQYSIYKNSNSSSNSSNGSGSGNGSGSSNNSSSGNSSGSSNQSGSQSGSQPDSNQPQPK